MTNGPDRLTIDAGPAARSSRVGEQAAKRLVDYILTKKIAPGSALPPEAELADILQIGRGTMREALRILQIFGMLDMRTGRYGGPIVRSPDDEDLARTLTLSFQANGSSMLDVMEARAFIEPQLARLAAKRITAEEIELLTGTVDAMLGDQMTSHEFERLASEFHSLVASAARSPVLSVLTGGLHSIGGGEIVGVHYGKVQVVSTATAHREIIAALESGDADEAALLWSRHLDSAVRYWKKKFPNEVTEPVVWTL
jgi:GntR family transcriptional regulator, transcriptional repressor for pyruvate dehydrogenase complex